MTDLSPSWSKRGELQSREDRVELLLWIQRPRFEPACDSSECYGATPVDLERRPGAPTRPPSVAPLAPD
jgi:hypothetical protein